MANPHASNAELSQTMIGETLTIPTKPRNPRNPREGGEREKKMGDLGKGEEDQETAQAPRESWK